MTVEGADALLRKLNKLVASGDRVAMAVARATASEFEKGIKAAIPDKYRSARKAIGRNVRKRNGEVIAKVGAGVGKRPPKSKKERKRGGVGLSKNNIHWAILGVTDRQTKSGASRGRHAGFLAGIIQAGASRAQIRAAIAARAAAAKAVANAVK